MADRIALVDADGVVVFIIPEGVFAEPAVLTTSQLGARGTHTVRDGTVQRIPSTVNVGDRWPGVCEWEPEGDDDGSLWEGSCGAVWLFPDDGPTENSMAFCPECGKPVEIKEGV